MNTLRFNITLPLNLGRSLRSIKNKSAFIAASIREKMEREKQESLRKELEAAYRASAREDVELKTDWGSVSGDGL